MVEVIIWDILLLHSFISVTCMAAQAEVVTWRPELYWWLMTLHTFMSHGSLWIHQVSTEALYGTRNCFCNVQPEDVSVSQVFSGLLQISCSLNQSLVALWTYMCAPTIIAFTVLGMQIQEVLGGSQKEGTTAAFCPALQRLTTGINIVAFGRCWTALVQPISSEAQWILQAKNCHLSFVQLTWNNICPTQMHSEPC